MYSCVEAGAALAVCGNKLSGQVGIHGELQGEVMEAGCPGPAGSMAGAVSRGDGGWGWVGGGGEGAMWWAWGWYRKMPPSQGGQGCLSKGYSIALRWKPLGEGTQAEAPSPQIRILC